MNVDLDIETIPAQPEKEAKALIAETITPPATIKKQETINDWMNGNGKYEGIKEAVIEEQYRKTALDGTKGEIISIAWAVEDNEIEVVSRDYQREGSEKHMLENFFAMLMNSLEGRPVYFIGHQIARFDLKFIWQRAVILGIRPPFNLPWDGRHDRDFFCTNQAWAGYGNRISQDNLCKALGIEGKPDDIDGSKVWGFVKAGNIERVAEYNRDDVDKNRQIYKRLNFAN